MFFILYLYYTTLKSAGQAPPHLPCLYKTDAIMFDATASEGARQTHAFFFLKKTNQTAKAKNKATTAIVMATQTVFSSLIWNWTFCSLLL